MRFDPNSSQATPLSRYHSARRGFTLVEVMIAAALTLMMMAVVVQLFARVGGVAADTRAVTQLNDRLRSARILLQTDLANVTAEMRPPLRPDMDQGYFEYVEGPDGPIFKGTQAAYNISETDASGNLLPDTTVGDPDDVLMFTARAANGGVFYGRARYMATLVSGGVPIPVPMDGMTTSQNAEICYFVRGDTLYRRVLLIADGKIGNNGVVDPMLYLRSGYNPPVSNSTPAYDINFYDKFDVSVHQQGGVYDLTSTGQRPMLVANSLKDLTSRQNRYGHQPWAYPYDVRFWDTRFWTNPATNVPGAFLGLPTLRECTFYTNTPGSNSGTARWPFPLFDLPSDPQLPAGGTEVVNLWGSAQQSPVNIFPYNAFPMLIYPYPSAGAANYQPFTTIPTVPTGRMSLTANNGGKYDIWESPYPLDQQDPLTGSIYAFSSVYQPPGWVNVDFSTRYSDDILLQHVLSFDVKAWDPTAPTLIIPISIAGVPPGMYQPGELGFTQIIANWASNGTLATNLDPTTSNFVAAQGNYVDLNYLGSLIQQYASSGNTSMAEGLAQVSVFSGPGNAQFAPGTPVTGGLGMLYDTGSFTYENDGIDQNGDGIIDNYTNGIDDNGIGGVDDYTEMEGPIPYPVPLTGIQIKIRMFDPDSREIREVTVTEDF